MNMNESNFVYKMTRLDNSDKKGQLLPDEDGCYTLCVGALNHASRNVDKSTGQNTYYSADGCEKFFSPGTLFNTRIQGGHVKAEYGHPKFEQGMNEMQYIERNMRIEETKVCCTFMAIWLVEDYIDPLTGDKCIGIFAKIKPSGPYGAVLEKELRDKGLNVCFSIRSLTTNKFINGRKCKVLHTVITFDFVTEPGITCAEKLLSPSLESLDGVPDSLDINVTPAIAKKLLEKNDSRLSLESSYLGILREISTAVPVNSLEKTFSW